ncbi:MAG: hypothetical protein DRJ15_04120 [Bacteroidetes bacterium]|nr:MAG: hypothetical protein DRJ15_04120 [Bacteroidota bacterium]
MKQKLSFCPECKSTDIKFFESRNKYNCSQCGNSFSDSDKESKKLRIFLSYGHDANEELVRLIKVDLEKRGHAVWFDKNDIKSGDNWRREITEGIISSNRVLSFLSKHSTRDPGVCLDEIAIAIGVKGGNIQTILTESETEVKSPASISHIQWLDMHDWKERRTKDEISWKQWYDENLAEIIRVVESKESMRFAGEIETLAKYLKPISSDSRVAQLLSKDFVGREWLSDKVEKWRIQSDRSSRLFWIMGGPGVGKSAFAAHLAHFGRDKIIAAQFCEWNKPDHRNAARVFRSLAFQLATRLPDYRKLLLNLPEINQLDGKNVADIFDYLFANPLQHTIDGGQQRYLILIDALDEAAEGERNPLVETLARHAPQLPEWLGMLITSRPESSVTSPLQGLNPFVLDTGTEENKDDIRLYLYQELGPLLDKRNDARELVEQILEKSEGVFLYVERVCDDLNKGHLSLDDLDKFPVGLGGIFRQFFDRQFPDLEYFRSKILPALRAILAAREPLPLDILQNIFNWQEEELYDFTRILGSLFPVIEEGERKTIKPYHKSLIDWLTKQNASDHYYVNPKEGHRLLADFGWQQYKTGADKLDIYFIKWLPNHLQTLNSWDDLTDLLCDLNFIQEKAAAKLTYELVEDINNALDVIPDNAEYIRIEKVRQERMQKYTQDLIACAEGKISRFDLEVPESISLRTKEQINTEIERIKTNPKRSDRLKDFKNFLGQEADNLQSFADEFPHFSSQQAWNYSNSGPVGKAANVCIPENHHSLLLHSPHTRPSWNPLPQVLKTLKGHTKVAITPDGKRAVSASEDKTCILWDLNSGEALKTLKGHTKEVYAVAITADGKRAISASRDETCILWDLNSGEALKTLKGHTHWVWAVAITPDGKRAVSASRDGTCILWGLNSGEALKTLKGHTFMVVAVAITPDGKRAVSASWNETILWDLNSGEALKTLKGHTKDIIAIAITPDGKRAVSTSDDGTCILWDLSSGEALKTLKGHTGSVKAVAITADGKRAVSASEDNTCIMWDLNSGEALKTLKHTSTVEDVAITPDGKRAVSASSTCILWDLNSDEALKALKGHTKEVWDVAITADGKRAVSASSDKTCILWDLNSGEALKTLKGHTFMVNAVAITPDGKRAVSASWDKTCILWDLNSGEALKTLKGHTSWVNAVAITPDGKRAVSASSDNTCILWDLDSGEALKTLNGHTGTVEDVAITPDGKRAVSASWETCILWDLNSGEALKTLKGYTSKGEVKVNAVAITPDGKRAVSASNTCILWDLNSGEALKTLKGHTSDVAITADGKRAVSASGVTCIMWDMETGKELARFTNSSHIFAVDFYSGGIFGCAISGEIFNVQAHKELLRPASGIVTARQIWNFERKCYMTPSANCPICGHHFSPPKSVLGTIEEITKKAGLSPEQSPCLELPDEAWEEQGLLSECPKCGEKLKFNPFIVGGED